MFLISQYLDLEGFLFADLFDGVEQCWQIFDGRLGKYCKSRMENRIEGTVMPGAVLEGEGVFIGKGSVVEPGVYIKGPALIGENTEVRHGAYLRGNVVVGNHCVVGHTTEVKNSVFLNGAKAGHFAYIGDSILGKDVNLGAGTKLANLKIIDAPIVLGTGSERIQTGLRKMGAVLGNRVEIGCNAVTSPGTILYPGSMVYPAIAIKGCFTKKVVIRESNMVNKT